MNNNEHVAVIDSHGLGYAAYYTTGGLKHADAGTGVIFGFLARVLYLGQYLRTNQFVFCWDAPTSSLYRRADYSGYKRKSYNDKEMKARESLQAQLQLLRTEILPAIGWANQCYQEGCESDDLMASIVDGKLGLQHTIVTGDEDLYQCLRKGVRIYSINKAKVITRALFIRMYGIDPSDWVRVKQLAGCTSDKVPGIQGVGEARAIQYIRGELKETTKAYQAIKENWDVVKRNYRLVKLPHVKTVEPQLIHGQIQTLPEEHQLVVVTVPL